MVTLGSDSHKRTHTVVAVDVNGRQLGARTVAATAEGHIEVLGWARQWPERRWALENWSGNIERHRLNRGGNRQLNVALHRIAITQMRLGGAAADDVAHRKAMGNTKTEAIRALRRRISDEVYRRLRIDHPNRQTAPIAVAA